MEFPRGMRELNENPNFNYQLNRLINWDGGDPAEVKAASFGINTIGDWKKQLLAWGDRAKAEGRTAHAIAYYRMSEFFMGDKDPDKLKYYRLASDLFYDFYASYFTDGRAEKFSVPCAAYNLPGLKVAARGEVKGVIVLHGGNDSYMEELFFPMLYLAEHGYTVYLFEGPGQGGVLREQGKTFIYEWEKPVKALLDYFALEDVTLIGVSLGGMLAPRAAAFEARIKRVVAWSVFPNFLHVVLAKTPDKLRPFFKLMLRCRWKSLMNRSLYAAMKKDPGLAWGLGHGMYAYGAASPYDYVAGLDKFQMLNVADKITQDVLLLQGTEDHFIDLSLCQETVDSLTRAASVTLRLFTPAEDAADHCQCGNTKLVLDTILSWLEVLRQRDTPEA